VHEMTPTQQSMSGMLG